MLNYFSLIYVKQISIVILLLPYWRSLLRIKDVHAERINNNTNIVTVHPSDLVITRTTVQSDKANGKVDKLCYTIRGPFQIIRCIGRVGYIVRYLNKPESPEFKFMWENLYILPPSLKCYKLVDGSDTCYLNQSHTPIVDPLKKSLNIGLHNENVFGTPPKIFFLSFKHGNATLFFPLDITSPFPSLYKLHKETNLFPPQPFLSK